MAEADSQYDINSQEIEQKSAAEFSIKKIQKLNKELLKQNAQLSKSMDILKKERELLVSEKVKMKGENRVLEKELKKVSSKSGLSSKKSFDEPFLETNSELLEKINLLEDNLAERDRKVSLLSLKLEKNHVEILDSSEPEDNGEMERPRIRNGGILDSTLTLERLIEEQDVSHKLRKENTELRSRLSTVEADLERSQQREMPDPSPKSPRKRPSGFFKRGKKSTSSMPTRHAQEDSQEFSRGRTDYTRSQSPDFLGKSDSHHEHLYTAVDPSHKESTISLPCYESPNQSPNLSARNRDQEEIQTLQLSLKVAMEEKSSSEEKMAQIEKELSESKTKLTKLEESMLTMSEKTNAEIEQLRNGLKTAEIDRDTYNNCLKTAEMDRDTYCEELKIAQQEGDEMIEKNEANEAIEKVFTESLSQKNELIKYLEQQLEKNEEMEKMFTESLSQKNELIKDLEQQLETLQKSTLLSPPANKPPTGASSNRKQTSVSPARDKILSPPSQPKDTKSGTTNSERKSERVTSTSESPKHERPHNRLSKEISHEKPPKTESSSHSRKVSGTDRPEITKHASETSSKMAPSRNSGRLSRETSVDKFEAPREARLSNETIYDKLPKIVPASPSRRSSKLSCETSTDKLEAPREAKLTSHDKLSKTVPASPSRRSGKLSCETSTDKLEALTREAKLSSETSHDKLSKTVPASPSRKSGRLSRETSTDKLEALTREAKLSNETSHDKLSKTVPASPSRKVGKLSRESSIDQFETPKETKRKHSTTNVPHPSPTRMAKVAATRALFQQKIDETTTQQPSPSNPTEKRRSSYCSDVLSSDAAKGQPQSHHSKSYSYDLSSKHIPKHDDMPEEPLPPVPPVDKSTTVPPTSPAIGLASGPGTTSNEAKNKINKTNHRQQEATSINKAAPIRGASTYPGRGSENVAKVSRITITSTASPSSSPLLGNRKDISLSSAGAKLPSISVQNKSPSPTSTGTRMMQTQPNSVTKTVSATIKHTKAVSVEESASHKTHHVVTKSNTEVTLKSPSNNVSSRYSSIWSTAPQSSGNAPPPQSPKVSVPPPQSPKVNAPPPQSPRGNVPSQSSRARIFSATSASTTNTSAPSPTSTNKVIVRTSSTMGNNLLLSPVNKIASLQDIPSQVDASKDQKTAPKIVESTVTTAPGTRNGSTHRVIQRRDRKDRPKTMYAGRAETTNLVNLISKFQEVEKEKKMKTSTPSITTVSSAPSPSRVNGIVKMNGTTSATSTPSATTPTVSSSSPSSSSSSTTFTSVTHRQHPAPNRQQPRPTTYYGGSRYACTYSNTIIKPAMLVINPHS